MAQQQNQAVLILEDGTQFEGRVYGATGKVVGTIHPHYGATGYQEILTSEEQSGKITLFTTPHIGNTGMNDADQQSDRIQSSGIIVRDPARRVSNFRAERSLDDDLNRDGVVGIQGIDTRALTRIINASPALRAGIFSGEDAELPGTDLLNLVISSR